MKFVKKAHRVCWPDLSLQKDIFFFLFHINLVNTQNRGERFDMTEKLWTGVRKLNLSI